jgi:hypothetical protein
MTSKYNFLDDGNNTIKIWGLRDWLSYFAPKPLSYIGHLWDWILPKYKYNWYDKIRCTLNPRQKWIKKHIEYNQWCDKVELIPNFLFGCVIHFVEDEECYEKTDWEGSSEGHCEFSNGLKECYDYVKVGRPTLKKELDKAWENLPKEGLYSEVYKDVNFIEEEIIRLDKKYMVWITENKNYMWT